jgi:hypothetical protein
LTLVVTAQGEDSATAANERDNSVNDAGAAYVFKLVGG